MSDTTRWVAVGAVVAIVAAYAGLSGLWTSQEPGWYAGLAKPSWQPPDWVFGVMWPLNFAAITLVGVVVARTAGPGRTGAFLGLLAVSVALALTWAYLFYVPHQLAAAAAALTVAAVLTVVLALVAGGVRTWLGWALTPYAVWLCVATSLAWGYWRLAD